MNIMLITSAGIVTIQYQLGQHEHLILSQDPLCNTLEQRVHYHDNVTSRHLEQDKQ